MLFCVGESPRKLSSAASSPAGFACGVSTAKLCQRRPSSGSCAISAEEITSVALAKLSSVAFAVTVTVADTFAAGTRALSSVVPPSSTTI